MSATDSNLSAPAYLYDLVCAVTESGLNATMLDLLSEQDQELFVCFAVDETGKTVQVPIEQIQDAAGVDPFSIPDGTTSADPVLGRLNEGGFLYAFRAKLGLPAGIAPDQMPDVIKLDQGNSQVTYQLFCAEFSVIVLNYMPRNQNTFTNASQSAADPWLFRFIVNMNLEKGADTPFNQLPPAAQQRIDNVDPDTMFSVQQLLLDVSTRALEGAVAIPGLDPASPAYIALTEVFIGAYWDKMAPEGSVMVGFVATPAPADVKGPSIVPTALTFEVVEYKDASSTLNEGLNTLNYLTVANNSTLPPATPFSWNWVDPADEASCHGVMAVRRGVFETFVASLLNPQAAPLSVDTNTYLWHDGESLYMQLTVPQSPNPAQWVAPGTSVAGADGWTPLLTINYNHNSSDSASTWTGGGKETGHFNYALVGDFSSLGNQLRLTINTQSYCDWNYYLLGIPTANFGANIVNFTLTATFTLGVGTDGTLNVTMDPATPTIADTSQDIDVSTWDHIIDVGNMADQIDAIRATLTAALTASATGLAGQVSTLLNGSSGWIYPGGKTFLFHDVVFSTEQDLVVRVVYADPTPTPTPAPALAPAAARTAQAQA
ncbi:hypothetical protein [Aeromicrobium sp.]|uniref:hypothetical protein n=1 Tax=Aeromicrobium sp. TaxID=1871063 RepID=UPI0019B097E4|nr:hypothetical protein [Aeromicrobium sp.]MBC7631376.1 hypothetical protein [Aeromicrobium sp.]